MPHRFKIAWTAFFALLTVACIGAAVSEFRKASEMADYSAQAALAKEIFDQLSAVPISEPYPDALSELTLTFPDGGDRSLLGRFDYQKNATGCTVTTTLHGETIVRSFP